MSKATSPVDNLDPIIIKWLYRQGWTNLHDVQERAIAPILDGSRDVIISAATASGKTEAAFLPACSKILKSNTLDSVQIIYISPLKALINDQFKRLDDLGEYCGIKVTPWHGDINDSYKKNLFAKPTGILLITPESLESLLLNHREWCASHFKQLSYFIVDEFHAFIGTERGYQLLSQLHRIEILVKHRICRIALSATLSNILSVQTWLRPNSSVQTEIIESVHTQKKILLQIRGYDFVHPISDSNEGLQDYDAIAKDIFKLLRGSTNLVFANSRAKTEYLATVLSRLTEENFVPLEFFPHHGSLSKELREQLESRLKQGKLPTTAICTQTLELGIDIGDVSSIAQVNAPQSVASLRQRIGRSGRRERDAVLRLFVPETIIGVGRTSLFEQLRDETFLSSAMLELVLSRWFEPPVEKEFSFSTLIQQILSVIAQYGSVSALSLWKLLCETGPFNLVTQKIFALLLRSLATHALITQMRDHNITLGIEGEKLVSRYGFYSSFKAQEEYGIDNNGQRIGTIPLNQPLSTGDTFLFAGKGWEVVFFNNQQHLISVKPYKDDTEPLILDGSGGRIHNGVREKMFELYNGDEIPRYLNKTAVRHFEEGRRVFHELDLHRKQYIMGLDGIYLFPWKGDRIMHTITQMLKMQGIAAKKHGAYIHLPRSSIKAFTLAVTTILNTRLPTETELAASIGNLEYEKYDCYLCSELLKLGYGYRNFDIEGAVEFFKIVLNNNPFNEKTHSAYQTV